MPQSLESIVDQIKTFPKLIIADDFEIAVQRVSSRGRKFQNGEAVHQTSAEQYWISLRLMHRRQPGRAVVHQCTKSSLQWLVETAFEAAKRSSVDPWFRFPMWKSIAPTAAASVDATSAEYETLYPALERSPEWLEESYEIAGVETLLRRKSEKFVLRQSREVHSASFALLAHVEGSLVSLREERSFARPLPERFAWLHGLLRRAEPQLSAKPCLLSGRVRALFGPGAAAALLKRLSAWLLADHAQSGMGPFVNRGGQQVVSPILTVFDHGALADGCHSAAFDLEGSATQQTTVFERGVLKNLLYDFYAATKENRLSTGNYLRPTQALHPRIASSNLYVKPGEKTLPELLKTLDHGLWIENIDDLGLLPGEETQLRLRASGWRVARGQRVEPVRDIVIRTELLELLSRAVELGSDLQHYGAYGSPSILFEEIPLG